MSTPCVDNPNILLENQGRLNPDSGFPFEDDFGDRNFRSQLDDIAQRHPEFAQHLNFDRFPSQGRRRRGSDERTQPPPENRRFERPFRSRFEDFGFPFGAREFEEGPFYREEDFLPTEREEQKNPVEEEKLSEKEEGGVKKNIQQSNTVDLGKNQEPVDDQRGQRSMSAPPENRPRFVSSINIPVQGLQTPGGGEQMGGRSSQPEKPMERVIPIHVEGRDEPVLPKNPNFTTNQQQQPQPERIFGRNPNQFTQFLNKGEPQVNQDELFKQQQRGYQQKQKENYQQQKQHEQEQPQQQQEEECCESQEEKKKPLTQLDQIQNIQKDVSELMNRVERFNGKPKDKEYLYLDEMLTRNLIKLDNIETEGKDNIRQARKEAIKCIEGCIGILEAKANANLTKENVVEEEPNQIQNDNEMKEIKDEVKEEIKDEVKEESKEEIKEGTNENNKEDVKEEIKDDDKNKCEEIEVEKDVPGGSLEVSGVARSGTLVVEETPMDVVEGGGDVKKEVDDKESIKVEEKKEKKKVTKKKEKK
ncbi:BAG domain-containing protein Samui isoform X1 [Onthophagus taurus]|uniref:BAG domain-containing protein Samui isoform X1 n=1 Tax=Onthophagus taurus TaxID=166361 RepID=UPI0039BE32CD